MNVKYKIVNENKIIITKIYMINMLYLYMI